jgi:hypothetical protein
VVRPQDYRDLPENRHALGAGTVLLPTEEPITGGGATSLEFVLEQGGSRDTFIFLFGLREARAQDGRRVAFVEGVFLNEEGPGFHATWGVEQLVAEVDLGGWKVVPTREVLASPTWIARIEERMNNGEA